MSQAQQSRTESVAVSRLHPLEELVRFQVRDDPVCRAAGQAGQPGDLGYSQLRALRRKAVEDSHRAIEALDPAWRRGSFRLFVPCSLMKRRIDVAHVLLSHGVSYCLEHQKTRRNRRPAKARGTETLICSTESV